METTHRTNTPRTRRPLGPTPYALGYRHCFNGRSPLDGPPVEDWTDEQVEAWHRGQEAGHADHRRGGFYGERATERV